MLLHQMREGGITANMISCRAAISARKRVSAAIKACEERQQCEQALTLFHKSAKQA